MFLRCINDEYFIPPPGRISQDDLSEKHIFRFIFSVKSLDHQQMLKSML